MYAVIESGSKQYKVQEGDRIEVELLGQDENEAVKFSNVLLLQKDNKIEVGAPHVANCEVEGVIEKIIKDPKLVAFKYKKRKNCRIKKGHRQKYTLVKITKIQGS